jgi:hypothetical protein
VGSRAPAEHGEEERDHRGDGELSASHGQAR